MNTLTLTTTIMNIWMIRKSCAVISLANDLSLGIRQSLTNFINTCSNINRCSRTDRDIGPKIFLFLCVDLTSETRRASYYRHYIYGSHLLRPQCLFVILVKNGGFWGLNERVIIVHHL